jgi:hypothetical protein
MTPETTRSSASFTDDEERSRESVLGREAAAVFRRLVSEHLATQLIESAGPGSDGQRVCRPHRFASEKAPDSILHGDRAGRDLATQHVSRPVLKLSAVGTLQILKDHQAAPGALAAYEHTPFRSVARRDSSRFYDAHSALSALGLPSTRTGVPGPSQMFG